MKILKVLGISVTFHSDSQTNKVLDFLKWKNLRLKEFEQFEQETAAIPPTQTQKTIQEA